MWKKIGHIILGAVVGFILGWFSNMAYSGYHMAKAMFMFQEYEIFNQQESAEDAYFHQSPEVAVWALEHYCTAVEKVMEQRGPAVDTESFVLLSPEYDLTFAHTRLGKLYGQLGNADKSQYHFDQALTHAKATNLKTLNTKEDCLRYLEAMDSKAQEKGIPSS
jgi:hypothetical protein